jgi:hypothetical protein
VLNFFPRFHFTYSVVLLAIVAKAQGSVLTFEGLGLNEGDPIPAISGITFTASAAIQGAPQYAFNAPVGADTGNSTPFNSTENTFITNPGGFDTASTVKEIDIQFPAAVAGVSFLAADIDSSPDGQAVERLTAEVFDATNNSLGTLTLTAPTTGSFGEGDVSLLDFGSVSGIRSLVIKVDNVGTLSGVTDLGFGVDNINYEIPEPRDAGIALLIGFAFIHLARTRHRSVNAA